MRTFISTLLLLVCITPMSAQTNNHGPFHIGSGIWMATLTPSESEAKTLTKGYVIFSLVNQSSTDTLHGYWLTKQKEERNIFLPNKESTKKVNKTCNKNCSNIRATGYYFAPRK